MIDFKPILDKNPNIIEQPEEFAKEFYGLYPDNEVIFEILRNYNFGNIFKSALEQNLISEDDFNIPLSNYNSLTSLIGSEANELLPSNSVVTGYDLCRGIFYLLLKAKGYSIFVEDDKCFLSLPLEKNEKNIGNVATKNQEKSSLHEHIDKVYTISPTCLTQKHDIHICQVCGRSYTDSFDMEGDHIYEVVDYVAPKCYREGYLTKKCIICGHEEQIVYQKIPHNYTEWVEKDHPTCITKGLKVRECKDCGFVEEKEIEPLGHNFSEWVEKENFRTRVCKNCGKKESIDLIQEEEAKKEKELIEKKLKEEASEKDKKKLFLSFYIVLSMFILGAILLIIDGIRINFDGIIHSYGLTIFGYLLILVPAIYCFYSFENMAANYAFNIFDADKFRFIISLALGIFGFCLFFNNYHSMLATNNYSLFTEGKAPEFITFLFKNMPVVLIFLGKRLGRKYNYINNHVSNVTYWIICVLSFIMVFAIMIPGVSIYGDWLFALGLFIGLLNIGLLLLFNIK